MKVVWKINNPKIGFFSIIQPDNLQFDGAGRFPYY